MLKAHHRNTLWIPWALVLLGAWLVVAPFSFGYLNEDLWTVPSGGRGAWFTDSQTYDSLRAALMTWSDVLSGIVLIVLGWRALRPDWPALLAAMVMLPMITLIVDEVVAMGQHVRDATRRGDRDGSTWKVFWLGGQAEGSTPDERTPTIAEAHDRPVAFSVHRCGVPPRHGTSLLWPASACGCSSLPRSSASTSAAAPPTSSTSALRS